MTLKSLNGILQKLKDRRIDAISFIRQGISAVILIEQLTEYGGNPSDIQRETRFPTKAGLFESFITAVDPVFVSIDTSYGPGKS
jgi:hypothetical protein